MQLHWKMQILHFLARFSKPYAEQTLEEMRRSDHIPDSFVTDMIIGKRIDLEDVIDMKIAGRDSQIPIRIYKPTLASNQPVMMFFHGGGFVVGTIDTHDRICRRIASEAGVMVISVEYRRAPEYKFPTALYDAYDATLWTSEHIAEYGGDASRVGVCGDSAGGALASGVTMMARDLSKPFICQQVLIYPTLDASLQSPSINKYANAPILTRDDMHFFRDQYIDEADYDHPYASALHLKDFTGIPPTMIIVAEYDPLHDDGEQYAKQLQRAGIPVEFHEYTRQVHGFLSIPGMTDRSDEAFADIATFIKTQFEQTIQPEPF